MNNQESEDDHLQTATHDPEEQGSEESDSYSDRKEEPENETAAFQDHSSGDNASYSENE